MDPNLNVKFGPPPVAPRPRVAAPAHQVLLVQFFVCALLLVVIAPPFVMRPALSVERVVGISLLVTGSTLAADRCGLQPMEVVPGLCEMLYRSAL